MKAVESGRLGPIVITTGDIWFCKKRKCSRIMKDDICLTVPPVLYFTVLMHQAAHVYEKFCICMCRFKDNIKIVIELNPLLNPPLIRFRQS
jgi:hypothetical protein